MSIGNRGFNTEFGGGGGGLSGLTEDQILFGAADGTVAQSPGALFDPATRQMSIVGDGSGTNGSLRIDDGDDNIFINTNATSHPGTTGLAVGNIGIGRDVFNNLQGGDYNIAIGWNAGTSVGNASDNIAIGTGSADGVSTSDRFITIGWYSGAGSNGVKTDSVFIGPYGGRFFGAGIENVVVGPNAGAYGAGDTNVLMGHNAGYGIDGYLNIAIGENALRTHNADRNIAIGDRALNTNYGSGNDNIALGTSTLTAVTSGYGNIAIGKYAGDATTTSYWNIAIGEEALGGSGAHTGIMNIAIGRRAMDVGASTVTGTFNTVIANNGMAAGSGNLTGGDNVIIGHSAGNSLRSGSNNTIIGTGAANSVSSGNQNTAIGSDISLVTTSYGNVVIGFNVGPAGATNNELWIDNSNTANPLIWGDFANDQAKVNGTFEITEGQVVNTTTSAAGDYTVLVTDFIILKTGITGGGDTVTLPEAPPTGQVFEIIDASGTAGANNITIDTTGAPLINGVATNLITQDYETRTVVFDGTNYYVR